MFNLDLAITEWRNQMKAGGIKTPSTLDELESHLREDVELQMRAGISAARAFEASVKGIGPAGLLKKEFQKSTLAAVLEKLMIAAAALVVAFGLFFSALTVILCFGGVGERVVASLALAIIFLTACGWPMVVSQLPVIHPKRKRQVIGAMCILAGFGASTFYVQVIHRFFEHRGDGTMLPAVGFFAILPIAIGFALVAALERAAHTSAANYRVSN